MENVDFETGILWAGPNSYRWLVQYRLCVLALVIGIVVFMHTTVGSVILKTNFGLTLNQIKANYNHPLVKTIHVFSEPKMLLISFNNIDPFCWILSWFIWYCWKLSEINYKMTNIHCWTCNIFHHRKLSSCTQTHLNAGTHGEMCHNSSEEVYQLYESATQISHDTIAHLPCNLRHCAIYCTQCGFHTINLWRWQMCQ